MVISGYHNSNNEQSTKIYINEKKDRFLLVVLNEEDKKVIPSIDSIFIENDEKKLVKQLKDKEDVLRGYALFKLETTKIHVYKYGEVNVGYGNANNEFEYVSKNKDSLDNHFCRTLFMCSLAYQCTDTDFSFDNATIS